MAATAAAPARPVTQLRARVVRHAVVVGVWAVDCVCAQRVDTDWAAELLGDTGHQHHHATLDGDGYQLDSWRVERIAHQRGTAYVRLVCGVSVRPARLHPTLSVRTLHGILDELLLARARAHATCARPVDVAAARRPRTSDLRLWLPLSRTTVRLGPSGGMPNGSLSPCTIRTGTVTCSSSGRRVFSGRPGGCSGNARQSTPVAPTAALVRHATRAPEERPPTYSGRSFTGSCSRTEIHAVSSCGAGAADLRPATR